MIMYYFYVTQLFSQLNLQILNTDLKVGIQVLATLLIF